MRFYASLRMDMSFYIDWLCERLRDGYFDQEVNDKVIHRYNLREAEEIIIFTRDPSEIYKRREILEKYPISLVSFLSLYDGFFDPHIKNKAKILECIRKSKSFCKNYFGYGPVFYTEINDKEWHLVQFRYLCSSLHRKVNGVYVDFKIGVKCQENEKFGAISVAPEDIMPDFRKIAKSYGLQIYIKPDISEVEQSDCVDMGMENSCPHLCEYCPYVTNKIAASTRYKYCSPQNPLIYGVASKKQKIVSVDTGLQAVQQTLPL